MVASKRAEDRDNEVGDNTTAFAITKPVNLEVLLAEFRKAAKYTERKGLHLVAEGNLLEASEENPITVWLAIEAGDKPDTNVFKKVVTHHDANAQQDIEVESLLDKAEAGTELTPEEIQVALRYLLATRGK